MDKVIFTVCKESKKNDKNDLDLARAIHLKLSNLSYPNSWLDVVKTFFVFARLCVYVRMASTVDFTMLK